MPDFRAQFRDPPSGPREYMGGMSRSCGGHPSLPKRHRWDVWTKVNIHGRPAWERNCKNCAMVDDLRWIKPRALTDPRP